MSSTKPRAEVRAITQVEELKKFLPGLDKAFENPLNSVHAMMQGDRKTGGISTSALEEWKMHIDGRPHSHMFGAYVDGKPAGMIMYTEYKEDSSLVAEESLQEVSCDLWVNDHHKKDITAQALREKYKSDTDKLDKNKPFRPHIVITNLAVDPEFRRQGISKLLLARAAELADKKKIPIRVDASAAGKPAYEAAGFVERGEPIVYNPQCPAGLSAAEKAKWDKAKQDLFPEGAFTEYLMVRDVPKAQPALAQPPAPAAEPPSLDDPISRTPVQFCKCTVQ